MDTLPKEILLTIFEFLPHSDRKALRSTCKYLYEVSLAFSIIKSECLVIDQRIFKPESIITISCLKVSTRAFYHCIIKDVGSCNFAWIFKRIGAYLKSLKLQRLDIHCYQFTHIVSFCQNLQVLEIESCDNLWIEGKFFYMVDENYLKNLTVLNITNTIYLTDYILYKFIKISPNIQRISIKQCILNCHPGVYNFNYQNSAITLKNPSRNVLTINYLIELLKEMNTHIKGIDFTDTKLNNGSLLEIIKIPGINLNYLNLNYCRELKISPLINFGKLQPNITELYLTASDMITNETLRNICTHLKGLTILNLAQCKLLTDEGISYLSRLQHLTNLNLSKCIKLTGVGISECSKKLKILNINGLLIHDEVFIDIVENFNFHELYMQECVHVTDNAFHDLLQYQKSLKKLELNYTFISIIALLGVNTLISATDELSFNSNEEKNLMEHENSILIKCNRFYEQQKDKINSNNCLNNLGNITSLNLSKCKYLTDAIFYFEFNLLNLKYLNISYIQVTNKGLLFLVNNFKSLEHLDLSGCPVDDISVLILVTNLKRLKHLILKDCSNLTNVALELIFKYSKCLEVLNVQGCSDMYMQLLKKIEDLPSVVDVIGSPNENYENYYSEIEIPTPPPIPPSI